MIFKREDLVHTPSEGFEKLYRPKPSNRTDEEFITDAGILTAKSISLHFASWNKNTIAIPKSEIMDIAKEANVHQLPLLISLLTVLSPNSPLVFLQKNYCHVNGSPYITNVNLRLNGTDESQADLRVVHWLNSKTPEIKCTLWPSKTTPEDGALFDHIFRATALLGKAYIFLVIIEAVYRWRAETIEEECDIITSSSPPPRE